MQTMNQEKKEGGSRRNYNIMTPAIIKELNEETQMMEEDFRILEDKYEEIRGMSNPYGEL